MRAIKQEAVDVGKGETDGDLLQTLMDAHGNTVVYSEMAWAVARKSSGGGSRGSWFADHGAHGPHSLTPEEMVKWASDWTIMVPMDANR